MKNCYCHYPRKLRDLQKTFMIAGFFVMYALGCPAQAAASTVQERQISIDLKNATFQDLIWEIEKQSSFVFVYSAEDLTAAGRRDMNVASRDIRRVLDKCFVDSGLEYSVTNEIIVVKRTPAPAPNRQQQRDITVTGFVYETDSQGQRVPLANATVAVEELGTGTTTDAMGRFVLRNLPPRNLTLRVNYLGFEEQTGKIDRNTTGDLVFVLLCSDFRLENVTVTGQENKASASTSTHVSRTAMDHMQTSSLKDIMALMPGGMSENQSLANANLLNIRTTQRSVISNYSGTSTNTMNSFGTAVIIDGAPLSNDANLQVLNPTQRSSAGSISSEASPQGGVDVRTVATDNISSVEIIRGVPSVEYGNLTSGAVLVTSKAGREPLSVRFKTNPLIYQVSANKGFDLGGDNGTLNAGFDYARDVIEQRVSYRSYTRLTGKLLYSNSFFGSRLHSNTSLDLIHGFNRTKYNPDDENNRNKRHSKEFGFRFNTNGTFNVSDGWLRNIKYTASVSHTDKNSYYEIMSTGSIALTNSMVDGSVVSNLPGVEVTDTNGDPITNLTGAENAWASVSPATYTQWYRVEGKEWNIFAKVNANFLNNVGNAGVNRIMLGADFKSDGNRGNGVTFDIATPPAFSNGALYSSVRPVSYKDIPFIHQVGAYIEDNLLLTLGRHNITFQAGLRYDVLPGAPMKKNDVLSPRLNLSAELIPERLWVRAGYGVTAKAPSVLYLYPEKAYYDIQYFSNAATAGIAEENRVDIIGTRVFDTRNRELGMATNIKKEVGLDLELGAVTISATAYHEKLKNGYALQQTPNSTLRLYKPYYSATSGSSVYPTIRPTPTSDIMSFSYYREPTNAGRLINKGVEFTLTTKRFESIRTQFMLSGAWMNSKMYNSGYEIYYSRAETARPLATSSAWQKEIYLGLYDNKAGNCTVYDKLITTLRVTHNIPQIGFVVTLTGQVSWWNNILYKFGDDATPLAYLSSADDQIHYFTADNPYTDEKFSNILKSANSAVRSETVIDDYIRTPTLLMNLNLTKEVKDYLRVSFFVNNMFSTHPKIERYQRPGEYYRLNQDIFFGLELSLTIK